MALDTYGKARWSPEEDEVILSTWKSAIGPTGQARSGFFKELHALFPHRTFWAVKNRAHRLVGQGKMPRQRQRAKYVRLRLSDADKGWLAGILDGEGSIRQIKPITRLGLRNGYVVQVSICYNTDPAIIQKAALLVPHAKVKCRYNRPRGKKPIYHVVLSGYEPILDYLECVLPYLAHIEKRIRANDFIAFIRKRLAC